MSMTLAARSHHIHHVSQPARLRLLPLEWFARRLRARPGATLAHCAFFAVAGLIAVNALTWQKDASPRSFIGEPAARAAAPQPIPAPPQRPAELAAAPAARPAASAAAPLAATPRPPAPVRDTAALPRDPIGDLIRTGQAPASEIVRPTASVPERTEARPVLAAQRALNRVGVGPVKADGVFGEETRAAIERFERERRIPVTRDLGPRTLRELAAASGVRIE